MSSFCFEERSIVESALKNYLSTEDFHIISFNTSRASDEFLGFLGDHSKLKVIYEVQGKNKEICFFTKSLPKNNQFKNYFINQHGMFKRELTMYSKVFNRFEEKCDNEMWLPKCYFYFEDLLIFEDLSLKGFKMHNIFKLQNMEHCLIGLQALARFHSKTIIYEENHKVSNYRISDDFQDILTSGMYNDDKLMAIANKIALRIAEESENFGRKTIHFQNVSKNWTAKYKQGIEMAKISKNERNVINHMDLWNNNIMFQYDNNEKPKLCVFVDYQVCNLSHPGVDIMSYLYMNTDKELRSQHLNQLLKHYYEELKNQLSQKNINIDKIYPEISFLENCMNFKMWGLVQSIFLLQFVLLDGKFSGGISNNSQQTQSLMSEGRIDSVLHMMGKDKESRERILSSVDEFISNYVI